MQFPLARQYFYKEIHQPDEQIDLAQAALYIAQEEYPNLDPDQYISILDRMATDVQELLPPEHYPLVTIQSINKYLYDYLDFTGNSSDYYNPCNSFLNDVIDKRTGIPITLSLLYMEIARRIDFPMVGIGMPGHFLMRPNFQDVGIFVDAFNRGEILFEQDCRERLIQIYQQPIPAIPASFLEPVSKRRFLARMLANLKMIYLEQRELLKALAAVERILLIFPDVPIELRDRGLLYYELGRWLEASHDLEKYIAKVPNAEDTFVIRQLLRQISKEDLKDS